MELVISENITEEEEKINIEEIINSLYPKECKEQNILRNTVGVSFDSRIKDFSTKVSYEYREYDKDEKQYTEYVSFPLVFKRNFVSGHPDLYLIKICGSYLCKNDFLTLYNALNTVVKTKINSFIAIKKQNQERIQDKIKNQLEMFKGDFYEPDFQPVAITLFIKSSIQESKDIKLSFVVISTPSGYGLMIDKKNSLSVQDVYFIYTNYHRIIKNTLDYEYQRILDME